MSDAPNSGVAFVVAKKPEPPPGTLQTSPSFWREFLRVQSDKLIMLILIVYLHWCNAPETLQAAAVGGLVMLVQGQRFKLG